MNVSAVFAIMFAVVAAGETGPAGSLMKLPPTPWSIDGAPILGAYTSGPDMLQDLQDMRDAGMNVVLGGEQELNPETPEGAFCRDNNIRVMHHLTRYIYHGAKLREPITAEQTTIPLYFAGAVPQWKSRTVRIDDEIIQYETMTEDALVDCRRACDGTTAAPHREGLILFWPEECAAEIARVKDSPNLFGYYVLDDSPGDAVSALRALYATVQKTDPGRRRPVCAGFGDAGSIVNFAPGVCDIMLIYWYPVSTTKYDRARTSQEVQRMLTTARRRVPGIPFVGVYQAFDGTVAKTGQGVPTAGQLREQLEDFVREGACGLVSYLCRGNERLPGWAQLPELGAVVTDAHNEIRRTGGLLVQPETGPMSQSRIQPQGYWENPRPMPGVPPAWYVVGPFVDVENKGLAALFPPDQGVDLAAVYPVKFGQAGWRVRATTSGMMGLTNIVGDQKGVQACLDYAFCDVTSPIEQKVQMRVCTDDDAVIRLNGNEIYRFEGPRGLEYDKDVVPITLPAGKCRIDLKVYNRAGMWGFFVRFTDTNGKPLEGLEFRPEG